MQVVTSTSFSMPGTLLREAACNLRRGLVSGVGIEDCTMTFEERFWSKVYRSGGPDACWVWTGCRSGKGYGQIGVNGHTQRAHRVAWLLVNGPISDGLCVLHRCDNPPCCNVGRCLFLGNHADNVADKVAKGRQARGGAHGSRLHPELLARGEANGNARLTIADVFAIRAAAQRGESQRAIAIHYGVSRRNVRNIVHRERWAHV